jgi:hypothetical protein
VILSVRTRDGRTEQVIKTAAELAHALDQAVQHDSSHAQVNPGDFFLLVEATRIRLAYSFDPFFAVSLSGVQALPHQLQAVYERMLPQARLRFLLADDPGAGKTIMAGLLLKELKLRGVIDYILILTPAPLTIQWQDELYSKFDETFEVVTSELVGNQLAGNLWERYRQCIVSLDFAKQEHIAQSLEQIPWDLVIIDEAHKRAAINLPSASPCVLSVYCFSLLLRIAAILASLRNFCACWMRTNFPIRAMMVCNWIARCSRTHAQVGAINGFCAGSKRNCGTEKATLSSPSGTSVLFLSS